MDLAREGVRTFVFGPLNRSEAYLSAFTGDCKDPDAHRSGDKVREWESLSSWQRCVEDVLTLDRTAGYRDDGFLLPSAFTSEAPFLAQHTSDTVGGALQSTSKITDHVRLLLFFCATDNAALIGLSYFDVC